jgi:hypothetical protein
VKIILPTFPKYGGNLKVKNLSSSAQAAIKEVVTTPAYKRSPEIKPAVWWLGGGGRSRKRRVTPLSKSTIGWTRFGLPLFLKVKTGLRQLTK